MKPEIMTRKEFSIIGMKYEGNNANGEIPVIWDEFMQRVDEIKNRTKVNECFGYDTWTDKINVTGEFTYVAGVEVTGDSRVPEGMVRVDIPEGKYAVFAMDFDPEELDVAVREIYSKWLPEAGLEVSSNYDFEYYNEDFDPNDKGSIIYFHVPIK